jgi:hypothetical protein
MALNIKQLKELIADLPDNMKVTVGAWHKEVLDTKVDTISINFQKLTSFNISDEED